MTIERKVGMGIAGQPSGSTDVADVFSTYLYTGDYGAGTDVNGIDLAGEGGMVWFKARHYDDNHVIIDTERGGTKWLRSNGTNEEATANNMITSFNSNGYTRGNNGNISDQQDFVSWTFRKKKKFFDVVTWTGNGVAGREISHGLDGPVGMMVVKNTSHARSWTVFHKSLGATHYVYLDSVAAPSSGYTHFWNDTAPTDTAFTLGINENVNGNGNTYVAYIFADNSTEDAEEQMIKCGGYTGTAVDLSINLGWEPQFVLVKNTSSTRNWRMLDSMRGVATEGNAAILAPNDTVAEFNAPDFFRFNSLGFELDTSGGADVNSNGDSYIYMAIRAPMMVQPSAATDVFAVSTEAAFSSDRLVSAGFAVDAAISSQTGSSGASHMTNRLTAGTWLSPDETTPQGTGNYWLYDKSLGVKGTNAQYGSVTTVWNMWKRAKGFMDVVAYRGTGSAMNLAHSLGAVPELVIIKIRYYSPYPSYGGDKWYVYHKDLGIGSHIALQSASAKVNQGFLSSLPTETNLPLQNTSGDSLATVDSSTTYISYLFATLAGISKVGSYSGNGTNNHVINCGFSSGARFILIKRSNGAGDWFQFDSARGITSTSNDPILYLNNSNAQVTEAAGIGVDAIQPHASGFQLASDNTLNHSELDYIFYAIA